MLGICQELTRRCKEARDEAVELEGRVEELQDQLDRAKVRSD